MRSFWSVLGVVLCLGAAQAALSDKDYYELLELKHDASTADVKKAYRKSALLYHPDKLATDATAEQTEEREQMFVALANAYEILSDSAKRGRYDFLLSQGVKQYNPNMDWERFDKMGLRSEREDFIFRDARKQFEAADANEERAIWLSAVGAVLLASLPFLRSLYRNWQSRQVASQRTARLKAEHDAQVQLRAEQDALRAEELKIARQKAAEERRLQQEIDEEEAEEGDGVKRSNKPRSQFECALCVRKYKSQEQLEAHRLSKEHKKAEGKLAAKQKRAQLNEQSDEDEEEEAEEPAAPVHSKKPKANKSRAKVLSAAPLDSEDDSELAPANLAVGASSDDDDVNNRARGNKGAKKKAPKPAPAGEGAKKKPPKDDDVSDGGSDAEAGASATVGQLKKEKRKQLLAAQQKKALAKQQKNAD